MTSISAVAPRTGTVSSAGWALAALALSMLLAGGSDLRIPARMWLVAQGSGITLGEARIGVVPLGVTAVAIALTAAIAHRVARAEITDLGGFAGDVAHADAHAPALGLRRRDGDGTQADDAEQGELAGDGHGGLLVGQNLRATLSTSAGRSMRRMRSPSSLTV